MAFWPFGRSKRLNTINLSGDLDDVELLMDTEKSFGIKITDDESTNIITMGDLEHLVRTKIAASNGSDPVWEFLCRIAKDHSRFNGQIDRETTFFAKDADERVTNG